MRTRIIAALVLAACLGARVAHGQIVYNQPASYGVKYYYSNWSLDGDAGTAHPGGGKDGISQSMVALTGFIPIADNLEARYYLATAFNSLDLGGAESSLSGIGDLRVQAARSFSRDRLLLSAGVNLPTGKQKLDPGDEGRIVGFLSRDYISVPLRRYGEGLGFNLQVGAAKEIGRYKCGMSAVFNHTGTYEPYTGSGDYNPGNSLSFSATSLAVIAGMTCTGDLGFSYYGKDDLNGRVIYRQAPQFAARFTATYPREPYTALLGVKTVLRGRNTRYSTIDGAIDSQLKKYGDELVAFLRIARELGKDWRLAVLAGTRRIAASEEELASTSLWNGGFDIEKKLSPHLGFAAGLLYHAGATDGGATDIRGLQVSSGLSLSF